MVRMMRCAAVLVLCVGCSQTPAGAAAHAGIDTLHTRLVQAYRIRDPELYGMLFTDTAVFEWPAFNTVRGRTDIAAMVRGGWATLSDMDLKLDIASRRLSANHATEFGAFQQSYRDAKGVRHIEYGRYVTMLARERDGTWRIDRFFGFADSTRP